MSGKIFYTNPSLIPTQIELPALVLNQRPFVYSTSKIFCVALFNNFKKIINFIILQKKYIVVRFNV